jgi:hypothetical protein
MVRIRTGGRYNINSIPARTGTGDIEKAVDIYSRRGAEDAEITFALLK